MEGRTLLLGPKVDVSRLKPVQKATPGCSVAAVTINDPNRLAIWTVKLFNPGGRTSSVPDILIDRSFVLTLWQAEQVARAIDYQNEIALQSTTHCFFIETTDGVAVASMNRLSGPWQLVELQSFSEAEFNHASNLFLFANFRP
jgi:hypothetical protein